MSVVVEELRGRLAAAPGSGLAAGLSAGRELLPVRSPLDSLLPGGGLARGSVVAVEGSVWLALALAAEASAQGSWCAAVGVYDLNPAAAAETGVDLTRFVLVRTRDQLATSVAALLDGVDVVLVQPDARALRPAEARRLAARARERRSTILAVGGWPEACDLTVRLTESEWQGLTPDGYGRLTERRCRVAAAGRGAAARERRAHVTFPMARGEAHRSEGHRADPRPRPRAVRPA